MNNVEFRAGRYKPEYQQYDRVYVESTAMLNGGDSLHLTVTHMLRMMGLIKQSEIAHECNIAAPCRPGDEWWKYEFEILPVTLHSD